MEDRKQKAIEDVEIAAKFINAPFNRKKLEDIFRVFGDDLVNNCTQFRITNKQHQTLDFRYWKVIKDRSAPSVYDIAVKEGFIVEKDEPVYKIYNELLQTFPNSNCVEAADFDASVGLTKLWYIMDVKTQVAVKDLIKLKNCPKSIASILPSLEKLNLNKAIIMGIDYVKKSFNMYFGILNIAREFVVEYLKAFDFEVPSQRDIELLAQVKCPALTVTWDSPKVQRICYYYPVKPVEKVKSEFGEGLVSDFAEKSPRLKENLFHIMGRSMGPKLSDAYIKLEIEYTGDLAALIAKVMHGDFGTRNP